MAKKRPDVEIIELPNNLLKVKSGIGPGTPDYSAIERAEAAITEFGKDYSKWGLEDISRIETALENARNEPDLKEEHLADIFRQAMDIKSQGGSFGYSLITQIGNSLKKFTEGRVEASRRDIDIIAAHVHAMRVVLKGNIKGDGGAVGREIVAGLTQLTSKL